MKQRELYSIHEARQLLGGISRNSLYQLLRSGELASVVIGCRRFISSAAIADLIRRATTHASPSQDRARSRKPAIVNTPLPLVSQVQHGDVDE